MSQIESTLNLNASVYDDDHYAFDDHKDDRDVEHHDR